jgi:large subunit ribosomal protein L18
LGRTVISTSEKDIRQTSKLTKAERAFLVGKSLAERALKKGFKKVVFDRAGYLYHGRIRKLAEGAREGGLEF